jgi:Tfp pilus assembly protein PilN
MVFDLLPWRQTLYQKRAGQILRAMLVILLLSCIATAVLLQVFFAERRVAQQRMADIQQQLLIAAAMQQSVQESYQVRLTKTRRLHEHQTRWQQNADWQAHMLEWARLDKTVTISEVHWAAQQLRVLGEADDAAAIRHSKGLMPAQQQNRQIELLPSGKFKFAIATQSESLSASNPRDSAGQQGGQDAVQSFDY